MKKFKHILLMFAFSAIVCALGYGILFFGVYLIRPDFKQELINLFIYINLIMMLVINIPYIIEEIAD